MSAGVSRPSGSSTLGEADRPLQVLVCHARGLNLSPASGEAQVAAEEVRALRARGHQVTYREFGLAPAAGPVGAVRMAADTLTGRRAAAELQDLVAARPYDVLHVHGNVPSIGTAAYSVAVRAGIRCFQTLHNYRHVCVEGGLFRDGQECRLCLTGGSRHGIVHRCSGGSLPQSVVLSAAAMQSRRWWDQVGFIAVSDFVRAAHVEAGMPAGRVVRKYNAVPPLAAQPAEAEQPAEADDTADRDRRAMALFVGRQTHSKGIDLFAALAASHPTIDFVAVGDMQDVPSLTAAPNLEQVPAVDRDALGPLYRRASVVVIPSRSPESFGRVAVEALQHGTPVVARSIGALPEVLGRGEHGTLLDSEAMADWRQAVVGAVERHASRGRDDARRKHLEQFSVQSSIESLEHVYNHWEPGGSA